MAVSRCRKFIVTSKNILSRILFYDLLSFLKDSIIVAVHCLNDNIELNLVQTETNLGNFIALMSLHKINIVSLEVRQPATWTICLSNERSTRVLTAPDRYDCLFEPGLLDNTC